MPISAKRMAILREHVRAESVHDIDALIGGMTPDCFNDIVGAPEPFVGIRNGWAGISGRPENRHDLQTRPA
jgi:hypothetical protein